MISELESRPSAIEDFRRLLFWIGVSIVLHAFWLYALQGKLPVAPTSAANSAIIYVSADFPHPRIDALPLLDRQPPKANAEEINTLFDTLLMPPSS